MDNNRFVRLNTILALSLSDGFSLDTTVLEQEMEQHTGIRLSSPNFVDIDNGALLEYVPFFENHDPKQIKKVTDRYESIKGPCSMLTSSLEELSEQATKAYQVAYFHYVLGKKNYFHFPSMCCGKSSKNVVLSLLEAGFPNAGYVISGIDHAYAILPFVFEKENIQGTLIIDPTYDQLKFSNNVRNAIFIRLGKEWEYKDPIRGGDLYPSMVCAIDGIRQSSLDDITGHYSGKEFFEKAFQNPVKINITLQKTNS